MPKKSNYFNKKGDKKHFNRNSGKNYFDRKAKNVGHQTREYQHQNQLLEVDVGITEFISKLDGFSGVIKARFSDFHVNEIDLNGKIAKLTDRTIPADFQKKKEAFEKPDDIANSPLEQIPQKTWEALKSIGDDPVELDASNLTKEDRTKIHDCLRTIFNKKICANTETRDDKKVMVFKKFDGQSDNRNQWPKDIPEYVHFLVYKECLDTLEASLRIAACLKISAANLAYAGVKDKRGKTTQWFSAKKVEPWKLIIKTKSLKNVKIGNITFKNEPLKLGQLEGNRFRIALRNVTGSDDLIEKCLQSLKENGFINYYGLQRFGNNKEVPTFSIGIQLLLGNWKEACQIILKPTTSDDPDFDITKAKKMYQETGDATKALEAFEGSSNSSIEYLLLSGLSKEGSNDFVNALTKIPRNTRLLYIHSFQSLVWNLIASKRIEKYGLEVVEGDLILLEGQEEEEETSQDPDENNSPTKKKAQVRALHSNECENYSIYDIVLPLPGYDIIYPENLKDCYKEILEKYGLTLEMTKQKVQTYSLSGTYRKLLAPVKDLSWKIMHYDDPNYNLIRSDFEELRGIAEPEDVKDGKFKALILEFSLNSSSYATMVLREILKTDTSSSSHAKLNNYHLINEQKPSSTENETVMEVSEKGGLLGDEQKYEAFKNIVFNSSENSLKRKHDDDLTENAKTVKTDDNTGVK